MTNLTWLLADIKTGDIQAELPLTTSGGPLERTVSKAMSSSLTLQTFSPRCPSNWYDLLSRKVSMIVPVLDGNPEPLHGFIPLRPSERQGEVPIAVMSVEHIAEAAYCRSHFFDGSIDDSRIIEALLSDVLVERFHLELDVSDCGHASEVEYDEAEDRLVSSAMTDLAGRFDGPEWTFRVRWADAEQSRVKIVVEVGPRIGAMLPDVVIDNKYLTGRQREQDWSKVATALQAVGDGSGADRPMSPWLIDAAAVERGEPLWEQRVTASTLDTEEALTEYGTAALAARARGTSAWEMSVNLANPAAPRPGRDFDAGDTVTMQLDPTPTSPSSWYGPARLIGWRMDAAGSRVTEFSPVFWDPSELEV